SSLSFTVALPSLLLFFLLLLPPPTSTLFPYTTLFRSFGDILGRGELAVDGVLQHHPLDHVLFADAELLGLLGDLLVDQRGAHKADRKSTRLNSSHVAISYAVFCLKKKKTKNSSKSCDT